MAEHDIQAAFVQWCQWNEGRHPVLKLAFAIPNGAHLAGDARLRAIKMQSLKKEGLRPGVPDWCLPAPRYPFSGLFIEFKYGKNKPSAEQNEYIARLRSAGHRVAVCYSTEEAIAEVENYLTAREGITKEQQA